MSEAKVVITAQDRATAVLRGISAQVSQVQTAFTALAASGGALAAGALLNGLKAIVSSIDDLADTAQGLGITAVELANFRIAAQEAGVGSEQFDGAVTRLNVKISEAAAGSEQAAAYFRSMGIAVRDAGGNVRPTVDVLGDIANVFAGLEDGPAKAALAVELFGKAGAKLIPLLNGGADGLQRFSGLTEDTVRQAQRLQAEFDRTAASTQRLKNELAGVALPFINDQLEAASRAAEKFRELSIAQRAWAFATGQVQRELSNQRTRQEQINAALAIGEGAYSNEGRAALRSAQAIIDNAQADLKKTKTVKDKTVAIDDSTQALARYVEQLQRESEKLEELSEQEKALQFLKANPKVDNAQTRELLLLLSEKVEKQKQDKAIEEERGRVVRSQLEEERRLREEVFALAGIAEENRKRALTETLELEIQRGAVTQEQALVAVKAIAGIREETEKSNDAAERLGLTIASSLGEWITSGGSASDFIKALGQDVLKLTTQLLILEPLAKAIKESFSSTGTGGAGGASSWLDGFGKLFSSLIGSYAGTFAGGGTLGAGQWGIAGEAGPEIVRGPAQIIPSGAGGNTINVNVQGNTDARTANQIAAAVARQLTIANRRYN